MVKGLPDEWGTFSRTVTLGQLVQTLSYHNNSVAVGSESRDIIILDVITGSQIAVLSGHTAKVYCVIFSSDGKLLVSGSYDKTVKLWDMQTGGVIQTFQGHTDGVWSVSISVDYTRIASGSKDKTVCLWDIQTGNCLYTIKQPEIGWHVTFSPMNPQHLISISGHKVWWWDVNGQQILPTYDSSHIAFSPDHAQFALCYFKAVTVYNSDSREITAKFHVAGNATYCCFSPSGRLVAAAAGITTYVWDISNTDPHLVETIVHTGRITSLVFSSPTSLISGSRDKSVKFWQIGSLSTDQIATDPGSTPIALPSIQSVSLQTRAGVAISSDNDGAVSTWDLSTGICKETFQVPAASGISQGNGAAQIIGNRLIFVWHKNSTIHIWDTSKYELLQTLDVDFCWGLRISGDGSKILSLRTKFIQAWDMWTWKLVHRVELGFEEKPYLDPLYTEGSKVWICFQNSSAQEGWEIGTSPAQFDPSTGRPHLDFIGGPHWEIDGPSWIKDTVSGKKVFQLSGRYAKPWVVQWDGKYLVAGYRSGEILILDFGYMYPQ